MDGLHSVIYNMGNRVAGVAVRQALHVRRLHTNVMRCRKPLVVADMQRSVTGGSMAAAESIVPSRRVSREEPAVDEGDVFGTLADRPNADESYEEEEPDVREKHAETRMAEVKPRFPEYVAEIKMYLQQKKLSEAIDVLETKMLVEYNKKPEEYIYKLLISACGRVGFTEKAFKLFNQMKKRGLNVTGSIYTSLFNACANSPIQNDGLNRAHRLRALMKEKGYTSNTTNYHAMMKAFGRCGDLETAFQVADEMLSLGQVFTNETAAFLLQACISDKEKGFYFALQVWLQMHRMKVKPTLYSYNLMMRCMRDCGVGDEQLDPASARIFLGPSEQVSTSQDSGRCQLQLPSTVAKVEGPTAGDKTTLLTPSSSMESELGPLSEACNRLQLFGGMAGFLQNMQNYRIKPDVKTFSLMLEVIPSDKRSEEELLLMMSSHSVKPDIDFFNLLIRKRNFRKDFQGTRAVMHLIQNAKLQPNLVTFGVLALGCYTSSQGLKLLADMDKAGFRPNIEILGGLLTRACMALDCSYVLTVMKRIDKLGIEPDPKFLKRLETFRNYIRKMEVEKDNGGTVPPQMETEEFKDGWNAFRMMYTHWLKKAKVDLPPHPWAQFKKEGERK